MVSRSRAIVLLSAYFAALALTTIAVSEGIPRPPAHVYRAIHHYWGKDTRLALGIAWCESKYSVWARNGQHLGMFQMGSAERRRFGHAWNPWTQARAARRYFLISGTWPWLASRSCWA